MLVPSPHFLIWSTSLSPFVPIYDCSIRKMWREKTPHFRLLHQCVVHVLLDPWARMMVFGISCCLVCCQQWLQLHGAKGEGEGGKEINIKQPAVMSA